MRPARRRSSGVVGSMDFGGAIGAALRSSNVLAVFEIGFAAVVVVAVAGRAAPSFWIVMFASQREVPPWSIRSDTAHAGCVFFASHEGHNVAYWGWRSDSSNE